MPTLVRRHISWLGLLVLLFAPLCARGAVFTVETIDDGLSLSPLTLRSALLAAQRGTADDSHVIILPAGTYALDPRLGELIFGPAAGERMWISRLAIRGAGAGTTIIDGGSRSRILKTFHYFPDRHPVLVTLIGVTLRNGSPSDELQGGAILSRDISLTLVDSIVEDNRAMQDAGIALGADEQRDLDLVLVNSIVRGNRTDEFGSAVGGAGRSLSGWGGGLVLVDSTVAENASAWWCGGVQWSGPDASLRLIRSTIRDNTGSRGGLCVDHEAGGSVENSTISGNVGGGLFADDPGSLRLTHSTVAANEGGFAIRLQRDSYAGSISFRNTLVAGNPSGNCSATGGLLSLGGNLEDNDTCGLTGPGDQPSTTPDLLPLGDNGGPTQTHLPEDTSPAIDHAPCLVKYLVDQRGVRRPQASECDVGSVEVSAASAVSTDLRIEIPDTPITAHPFEKVTFRATVTNAGTATATAVTLAGYLPAQADVVAVSDATGQPVPCSVSAIQVGPGLAGNLAPSDQIQPGGDRTVLNEFICDLGALAGGLISELSITVVPNNRSLLFLAARVASAESDPDPSNNTATATTIVDTVDTPPVADAGKDIVASADNQCGGRVGLDGTGSSDPDGDQLYYVWTGPFGKAIGPSPTVSLPLGIHTATLTVDDRRGGTASDTVTVDIRDETPPSITSASLAPSVLWPPDHKMVPVAVAISASDSCSKAISCRIESISSNEPVIGIDKTAPDWLLTAPLTAELRAERTGSGNGRTYFVTVGCSDSDQNVSRRILEVRVPLKPS